MGRVPSKPPKPPRDGHSYGSTIEDAEAPRDGHSYGSTIEDAEARRIRERNRTRDN